MRHADRNVGRLVFTQQLDFIAARHLRRAADDDPVFGAVMMHLQGQLAARIDRNALDLETVAQIDAFVAPPWAIHLGVLQMLGTARALQVGNHLLDALHLVLVHHQHGVRSFHHDHVLHADQRHDAAFGAHQRIAHVVQVHIAAHGIAGCIARQDLVQRGPGAHVAPADIGRHDHGAARVFHHGIIDGVGGTGGELLLAQTAEIEVAVSQAHRRFGGVGHGGLELRQFLQIAGGAEEKHAAVPEVVAAGDKTGRALRIGFFHKSFDLVARFAARDGCAATDVAITRFRRRRHDAEGGQRALRGGLERIVDGRMKGRPVFNDVIGRQHQHDGLRVERLQIPGGGGDGRRRVAAHRFEHDGQRFDGDIAHLLGHEETVLVAADQQRRHHLRPASQAQRRFLQHGFV